MKKDVLEDFEKKFTNNIEEELREEKEKERKEEVKKILDKDEENILIINNIYFWKLQLLSYYDIEQYYHTTLTLHITL